MLPLQLCLIRFLHHLTSCSNVDPTLCSDKNNPQIQLPERRFCYQTDMDWNHLLKYQHIIWKIVLWTSISWVNSRQNTIHMPESDEDKRLPLSLRSGHWSLFTETGAQWGLFMFMCGGCCYYSHLSPRGFVLPSLSNTPLHHYGSCQPYSMYAAHSTVFSWVFLGGETLWNRIGYNMLREKWHINGYLAT